MLDREHRGLQHPPQELPQRYQDVRLAKLEDSLDEVGQNDIPALRSRRVEHLDQEIREYVRVKELAEFRRMLDEHIRQCTATREDMARTPSQQHYEREKNSILMYLHSGTVRMRTHEILVLMRTRKSRAELNKEYGRMIVDE